MRLTSSSFGFEFSAPDGASDDELARLDGPATRLTRQFAAGAATFVDIGAGCGFFSVLAGLANPACHVISLALAPSETAVIEDDLRANGVVADVRVAEPTAGVAAAGLHDLRADGPLVVRVGARGDAVARLESMRELLDACDDARLLVEFDPDALAAVGHEPACLPRLLIDLGFDVFFLGPKDGRPCKCRDAGEWRILMEGERSLTLCCVRTSRSLHLCAFSHSSELGGAELCLAELIGHMTSRFGSLFTVVLPNEGPLRERVEGLGATTVTVDFPWWCADPAVPGSAVTEDMMAIAHLDLRRALSELARRSPDAVLTSTVTIPWGAAAAAALGCPHIWWVHEYGRRDHGFEFLYGYDESLEVILKASNHVIATSQAVKDELFPGASPEECSVASYVPDVSPSGVGTVRRFERAAAIRVLICGRVVGTKGQAEAIRAVGQLVESGRDVELCVAGALDRGSAYASLLVDLIEEWGLEDRVHLLGPVPDMVPLMREAQVCLMCSQCEAYGRVTAEAMLLGRPVIGTHAGGTAELIEDGVDGFLYPPGDAEALAGKIGFFVDHPGEIVSFGERAERSMRRRIAAQRVDTRLFDVCLTHKGGRNPRSAMLARLAHGWASRAEGALERRVQDQGVALRDLEDRAAGLQRELDARTEWALALERDLTNVRSGLVWKAHRALEAQWRALTALRRRGR